MPSFNKSFASVYLAVVYASLTSAVPSPLSTDNSTHREGTSAVTSRSRVITHPRLLRYVHRFPIAPLSKAHAAGGVGLWRGLPRPSSFVASASSLNDTAIAFVQGRFGVDPSTVGCKSGYTAAAEKFAYIRQTHVCTLAICLTFIVSLTLLLRYRMESLSSTLSPT